FTVGVWIQFAILAAVVAVCERWVRVSFPENGRWRAAPVLLVAMLVVDLLNALPYDIKPDGIEIYGIGAEATRPSVHALAIGRALAPTQGRALAIGGTQLDAVLPALFSCARRNPVCCGFGRLARGRLFR